MSPYYADEWVTLYHGDALEVLPTLPLVEMVLTDPPYNVGKDYGQHDDRMPPDEYEAWCRDWFALCRAKAARIVIFPGHGNLPLWMTGDKPSAVGCWYKPGNPAGGGVFQFCEWEPFLVWGKAWGGSDVLRAPVNRQGDTGEHPCPKPRGLFAAILERGRVQSVIDPFVGSGTTLVAAKQLGRKGVGIELEERYCEIAAKRLSQGVLDFGETA